MRELRFRAWDGGRMQQSPRYVVDTCDGVIYDVEKDEYHDWPIMQYTGFKDRNGDDVYEGDLVAAWEMEVYEIVWDGQFGSFLAIAPNDSLTMEDIFPAGATDFAVVGNIHEDSGGVTSP